MASQKERRSEKKLLFLVQFLRGLEAVLTSIQSTNSWQIAKYNIRPINAALASVLHEIQFASPVCLSHSTAAPTSIRP